MSPLRPLRSPLAAALRQLLAEPVGERRAAELCRVQLVTLVRAAAERPIRPGTAALIEAALSAYYQCHASVRRHHRES